MRTHTLEVMDDDGDLMLFETNSEDPGSVAITWTFKNDSGAYKKVASLMFEIDDVREIRNFFHIASKNHVKSSIFDE
jgi:hypothetical protein